MGLLSKSSSLDPKFTVIIYIWDNTFVVETVKKKMHLMCKTMADKGR